MGKLSEILRGSADRLRLAWEQTEAAGDFAPLPRGDYVAHAVKGELVTSRTNGTPGYRLTFRVAEGEHAGRRFIHDAWITDAALPMTKRDPMKLGITSLDQLEQPLPRGIRCRVKLVLRQGENGTEFNHVRSFDVLGIDQAEAEPFAPTDDGAAGDVGAQSDVPT